MAAITMTTEGADVARRIKAILVGSLGNLVEWYDFYAYSAFSLYFAKSFFPGNDPVAQNLSTAAIFAIGFFMRPVGGWLFGLIGDTRGRRTALMLSVLLMCLGSLLIACAPTYARIGIGAPALLLVARLLQGLSLGGEYGASATYLSEMATPERRGFYSSFQYVTLIGWTADGARRAAGVAERVPDRGTIARLRLAHPSRCSRLSCGATSTRRRRSRTRRPLRIAAAASGR
jgi:MHS family alpha-ketoglutarate permease-like MFS transporter